MGNFKTANMLVASTLRLFCLAITCIVMFAGFCATHTTQAFASTQLKVGEYVALSGVPASSYYADGLLNLSVKSSDNSVVSCTVTKPEGYTGTREYFAHARGFGYATVKASWKVAENVYNKKTGKTSQKIKRYKKTFEYRVEQGNVKARYCDHIYAKKAYSISALFKSCRDANDVTYLPGQTDGVFIPGAGYSVSSDQKKVTFEKATSNVLVYYQIGSTMHSIKVAAVHSKDSVVSKVTAFIKKAAYIPTSFKLKSVGMSGGKVIIKFSLVNMAGVTKTSKVSAGFEKGGFKWEHVNS